MGFTTPGIEIEPIDEDDENPDDDGENDGENPQDKEKKKNEKVPYSEHSKY